MPGAWELQKDVLAATLCTDICPIAWAMSLRQLHIPGDFTVLQGMPFDSARNAACQRVLEGGYKYLFFLDSDVLTPPDTILRLIAHGLPIVSGLYYRRQPPLIPVMLKGKQWITEWNPPNSRIEVDMCGAGCLLIRRDVLEKVPPPWFNWQLDKEGTDKLSEDFAFCMKAKAHGFTVHVDTSIVCRHIGYSESVPGGLQPLRL